MSPVYPDQWSSERFTPAEIDQLLRVASELSAGAQVVDSRRLSAKVRRWLERWGYCERTAAGFSFTKLAAGVCCDSWLPVEALWRVVSPMLGDSRSAGYSIRKNHEWRRLNVFTADQHLFSPRDEEVMVNTLLLLASHGYLYFQFSGSVWEVTAR